MINVLVNFSRGGITRGEMNCANKSELTGYGVGCSVWSICALSVGAVRRINLPRKGGGGGYIFTCLKGFALRNVAAVSASPYCSCLSLTCYVRVFKSPCVECFQNAQCL